jgi:very-short-patch-repair endonuclease
MSVSGNETIVKARELRRSMSLPEGLLWQELRKRPGGFKFRRQHPCGPFILDFYCALKCLAIEVDGFSHSLGDRPERDAARDAWLTSQGIRTIRFDAKDVLDDMPSIVRMILETCSG